jgi:2-methylisocitrate lyase-like PEP mutase family enzyme
MEDFQGKIEAAVNTRRDPDFLIIVRTEALIAGLSEQEAFRALGNVRMVIYGNYGKHESRFLR